MKNLFVFTVIVSALFFSLIDADAQIKVDVKGKVEEEADRRANQRTEEAIDAGFDKVEEGIKSIFKKKEKKEKDESEANEAEGSGTRSKTTEKSNEKAVVASGAPETQLALKWNKYDFVPGDKVIFEDNLVGEKNGEFPSRWDLYEGNAECAVLNGENVIMFRYYGSTIVPYMKKSESDYLPDIFTVEFDAYIPHDHLQVFFHDRKNQEAPDNNERLYIMGDGMELGRAESTLPGEENLNNQWIHVAIAYTKGSIKAYMNETRLINIPNLGFNPTGISIGALHAGDESHYFLRNIRIAEGGVSYYDRFLQDGKIIANGIRFDVNKATLKPESMGIINEIATLMKEHPEIKFSVEGHTDSDGDDAFNQKLSEQRAETVVGALAKMGIASSRLSSKGWGESKPLDSNGTPEGKANNRRVEFVKT